MGTVTAVWSIDKDSAKKLVSDLAGPLLVLGVFVGALAFLHYELRNYHWSDFKQSMAAIPAWRLAVAAGLTCLNYVILVGYDQLGIWYIKQKMSLGRVALASFLGYSVGNNIGTLLGGSTIRYRLYTAWGLSAVDILKLVFVLTVTFWVGLFALAGTVFLFDPTPIPSSLHLPLRTTFPLGVVLTLLAVGYLALCGLRREPLKVGKLNFAPPPLGLALLQFGVAAIDLLVASGVLYVLLPPELHVSFPHFVSIYLLAILAGFLSQVPGGLGVLELVIIVLLQPADPSTLFGALLAYRVIYFLVPLVVGLLVLAGNEFVLFKRPLTHFAQTAARLLPAIAPRLLAVMVFLAGAMLLFSGAVPGEHSRLKLLRGLLPLSVIEFSHFTMSILGAMLLLLARGLQRRVETAYYATWALLALGIVLSLLKGFDYEEAMILAIMLAVLHPCRPYFYRKGALLADRFSLRWFGAVGLVIACSVWLMLFAYKHVEYGSDLWWKFAFLSGGTAPRSLRALVGAVLALLFFTAWRLLRPKTHPPAMPGAEELECARHIVAESPQAYSHLALLGDKRFLFNQQRTAFIMYGVEGRSWVSLGDPVGDAAATRELAWDFYELCDQGARWPVFYHVNEDCLSLYVEMGLTLIKIGESARVPLPDFSLEGSAMRGLRYTHKQVAKHNCEFEVIQPPLSVELVTELRAISDAWLAEKNTAEKGFSLGFFHEDYISQCPVGIVRQEGRIVAFANLWPGADREELSADMMRYLPEAPPNVMEYLFIQLMLWGREQGYQWFDLGMAPLAGIEEERLAPLWSKVATLAVRHGEHFYNFQGLRQYKEKFHPVWRAKYIASPGGLVLPVILTNVAALISGGLRGVVSK